MLSTLIVIGTGLLSLSSAHIFECDRPNFSISVPSFNINGQRMTPYKCADEGKPCYFRLGTQRNIVIYGRPLAWAIKTIDHAIVHECTNDAMGCDPIEGFGKACYLIPWKWIQDATRRRLIGVEGEELDSLTMEEADNLIEEWLDKLNADNSSEQNEQEIEKEELEFESMMKENALLDDLELEEGDDIADSRLYSFLGIKGLGEIPAGGACVKPPIGSINIACKTGCCGEYGKCVYMKRDWIGMPYCPAECRGSPFGPLGSC